MVVELSVVVDQSEWIGENIRVDRLKQVAILIDAEPKGLVDQSVRDGFCRKKLFALMGQELIEGVGECHDQWMRSPRISNFPITSFSYSSHSFQRFLTRTGSMYFSANSIKSV